MSKIKGGCLCGAVRYNTDAEPLMTAVCHCKKCQRQSGTAFSVVIAIPKGSLRFEGREPESYGDTGDSGLAVNRRFCATCGSPIFSEAAATPQLDWLKAGSLDDTTWVQPQINIWCESAQRWVRMDDAIPKAPRNPPLG
jgi:hypothetical protein